MNRVVVDETLRSKLENFRSRLELCDESGHVLGYLTPAVDPAMYQGVESPTSPEELQRRSQEGGGRELADILQDLEKQG